MRPTVRRPLWALAVVALAFGGAVAAITPAAGAAVPDFSVTPSTLSFGDVFVGQSSAEQTVTLEVPAGWSFGSFTTSGPELNDFTYDVAKFHACVNVPGPTSCELGFTFVPTAGGERTATVTYQIFKAGTTDVSESTTSQLTGTGVGTTPPGGDSEFSVAPTTLDFGNVAVGANPPAVAYVNVNVPAGLKFLGMGVDGGGGDFGENDPSFDACYNKPGPITCPIGFTFSPDGPGRRTATGNVSAGPVGGGDSVNLFVALEGTGVTGSEPGAVPGLSVTPAIIYFGDVGVDTTSGPLSFTVAVPTGWTYDSLAVSGPAAADFTFDTNDGGCLSFPGPTSCPATFTFTPSVFGVRTATVTYKILKNKTKDVFETLTSQLNGTGSTNAAPPRPPATVTPAPAAAPLTASPRFTG